MENTQLAQAPAAPLRVFVAEDSALIRKRLETMLAGCGAVTIGHATSVGDATQQIVESRPDLVILDIQLHDGTGFDVLRALQDRALEVDVLMFSNFSADPYRQLAGRLGVRGFFDKTKEFGPLRDAVVQRAARQH